MSKELNEILKLAGLKAIKSENVNLKESAIGNMESVPHIGTNESFPHDKVMTKAEDPIVVLWRDETSKDVVGRLTLSTAADIYGFDKDIVAREVNDANVGKRFLVRGDNADIWVEYSNHNLDAVEEDVMDEMSDDVDVDGYFPDGANYNVADETGVSSAKHGDNGLQKSTKVAEDIKKSLVYKYRKHLAESKK